MRMQLRQADSAYSPERVLEIVRRIQFHQINIAGQGAACGITELTKEQVSLFDSLRLNTPSKDRLETAL